MFDKEKKKTYFATKFFSKKKKMKYDLIIVSGKTPDSNPSFILSFSSGVYLFNVPDQTQRIFRENKIRFQKLSNIFLTSLHNNSFGGMQGILITVFDTKNSSPAILAPDGIEKIMETYSQLHTNDKLSPEIVHSVTDENITATEIPLFQTKCYDIHLCDVPGKFLVQKAKELNIPAGPLYRQLQDGNEVTLSDGRVIQPSQVIGPPTPGDHMLVVDCRCDEDVDMLPESCKNYDFVVHFTPIDILMSEKYLNRFAPEQKSIVFAEDGGITFPSVSSLYSNVMSLAPDLFKPLINYKMEQPAFPDGFSFVNGYSGLDYAFCPVDKKKFIYPPKNELILQIPVCENAELPQFNSFAVTFCGTGSTYPSKYRNVSGIVIHAKNGFIILDAGEGFIGQITRKYGRENVEVILKNLLAIFVSHNHGDHVFGLYQILQTRAQFTEEEVPIICPPPVKAHIQTIEENCKFGSLRCTFPPQDKRLSKQGTFIQPIPVIHSKASFGCVVTVSGGYRIAYSGDRCILDDFGKEVGGCDLLIHESTFSDDLATTAADKRHSTMKQAIQTGEIAGAKYVVLTHFSQRYPKLPVFEGHETVAFAFDYLSFSYENMDKLCDVCPKVFQMISELEEKDEETK